MTSKIIVNTEYIYSNTCCAEIENKRCKIRKYNETNVCKTHFKEIIKKFINVFNKYHINNLIITKKYINLCHKNNIPYYKFINILTKYQRKYILNKYNKNEKSFIITDFVRKTAEKNFINKLNDCIICYDKINNVDELASIKCGHHYHKKCIKKYLYAQNLKTNNNGKCPLCRSKIDTFIKQDVVLDFNYKFDIDKLVSNEEINSDIKNYFVNKQINNNNEYSKLYFRFDLYKYSYESVDTIEKIIKSIFYNNFENKENLLIKYFSNHIINSTHNDIYYNKSINNGNFVYNIKLVNKIDKKNMYCDDNSCVNISSFSKDIKNYHNEFCKKEVIKQIIHRIIVNSRSFLPINQENNIKFLYEILDFKVDYNVDTNNINFHNINLLFKYFDEYISSNIYYIFNSNDNRGKNIKDIIYIDYCNENNKYMIYLNYEKLLNNFILLIRNYYNGKVKNVYDKDRENEMSNNGWFPKRYQTTDINDRKWFFNITNDNYGIFNNAKIPDYSNYLYNYFLKYNLKTNNNYNNVITQNKSTNCRCKYTINIDGIKENEIKE